MAQIGKLEVQTEIQSSPDKFYGFLKNNLKGLVDIFSEQITSVELLEGDESSAGAVHCVKYVLGVPMSAKVKVEEVDDANKSLSYTAIEGDHLMQIYKSFKAKVKVNEGDDGTTTHVGSVKWSFEYEKAFEGAPDADPYAKLAALISKGLDAYLL